MNMPSPTASNSKGIAGSRTGDASSRNIAMRFDGPPPQAAPNETIIVTNQIVPGTQEKATKSGKSPDA